MTTTAKRAKLQDLINEADDEQIETLYSMLEDRYEWWEDDDFVSELEQRVKDVESGKDKGYTWEEVKENARLSRISK